ncbi:MAG: hypothetical protein ABEJ04_07210 [Halobacteriaceae archaeon]
MSGASGVAFVVATVYTVSFDGFTSTPEYQDLLFASAGRLGLAPGRTSVALYAVGLVGFVAAFALVVRAVARVGSAPDWRSQLRAFAPTVLPIAVGYEFAHYAPYVVQNAARALHVALGFAVASPPAFAPLAWLSLPAYWGFEVVAIVAGHVVAVVATHRVALARFGSPRVAWRAHLPLVALMVGYTVLSLWLVSRPVVA